MNDTPGQPNEPGRQPLPPQSPPASGDGASNPQDERGSLWDDESSLPATPAKETPAVGALFNQMLGRDAEENPQPAPLPPATTPPPQPAKQPPQTASTPAPAPALAQSAEPVRVTAPAATPASTPAPAPQPAAPRPADEKPIVRLVNVSKSFGSLHVLRGVNLDIYPGQTTVIIGPSGTGKSVLLKHITGLLRPDQGEIWFHGQRIDNLPEKKLVQVRKRMGFLFQMGALFDSMTVGENIMFPLTEHNKSMSADEKLNRCQAMLKIVGLSGIEKKMPGDLSGGQKKRVALARAIVLEPELVLYDEPTTGLDPIRSDVINELILGLTRQLGIASIVVTHDMVSADKIADRMIMLYDGNIVIDGTPEVFHQTDNDLVRRFIKGQADQQELDAIRQGIAPVAGH